LKTDIWNRYLKQKTGKTSFYAFDFKYSKHPERSVNYFCKIRDLFFVELTSSSVFSFFKRPPSHSRSQTHFYSNTHAHTLTSTHLLTLTFTHTHTHTLTNTHLLTHTFTDIHIHTHSQIQARTNAHVNIDIGGGGGESWGKVFKVIKKLRA